MQQGKTMLNLVKRLRKEVNKPIWMWTGYTYEEILNDSLKFNIVKEIDVLVDGRFQLDKRDLSLMYRGSSNQRVIDIPKTLESGKVVLLIL